MTTITERINALISQRTSYGVRNETTFATGYILVWSNGAARWLPYHNPVKKGEVIQLDANQIFVPIQEGESKADIEAVIPSLKQLPLYGNSFEARFIRRV